MPDALALMLAAAVLLLAAAGFILWRSGMRARSGASESFLADRLAAARTRPVQPGQAAATQPPRASRRHENNFWSRLLLQAGIKPAPRFYLALVLLLVLVPTAAWLLGGVFSAAAGFLLVAFACYFHIWYRADKRKRRMIGQLPGFLDAMVRLITIGNSMNAAFQNALINVDEPLLEPLRRADALSRSGMELDAALLQVSRQYEVKELFLIASVVALAVRFGGRSDQVLERMAAFMLDLEQARDELVASSAEVRLSAWILALLPLGIALFIILFNNTLFMGMWNDPLGAKMLMTAVGLQAVGSYLLYRMARAI